MAFPVTGHLHSVWGRGGTWGCISTVSTFFWQCLHKSSSSTICLLPRSLESGREQWDIFHVARSQLGPQYYNASLLHWLHVSGVSGQCFALYTKSAKNNHPYHFTYINTQPVKYYQVKHTGAEYDQIRRVQFHNLWGRHTAGIRLFGKWSPLLHFLLDFQFYIAHSLGVSLTRTPIHHFSPFHLYHFSSSPSALLFFFNLRSSLPVPLHLLCCCLAPPSPAVCVLYCLSPSLSLKK